ncbi:hypothetical protein [Actinomadura rugatobispora]|uniref:Uncharacterized protein n=1 Tax=Actinomadura rugatobispora TaxID=1994 RepID=A0ABW1A7H3_9ACTN|nr:hypothetical protein GCM10010200_026150 [Actinomadura rugatobispora]
MAKSSGGKKSARRNGAPSPGEKMRMQGHGADAAAMDADLAEGAEAAAPREGMRDADDRAAGKAAAYRPASPENLKKRR